MANVDRVFGFRPVMHLDGSPWSGKVTRYWIAAADGTATFVGDLVKLGGTASASGVPSCIQAAAGNTPLGVVVWFEPNPADLSQNYRTASQNLGSQEAGRYVYVADEPDLICEVQEDAVGGALAVGDVGLNADIIVAAGSTTTGQSGMELDTSTKNTTSTLVLRIHGFVLREDNEVGVANAKVLVGFNVHQFGSVGVAGA